MSNPLKKQKTDYGAFATVDVDSETLIDDNNRRRKSTAKAEKSSIVKVVPTCLLDCNDDCLLEIFDRVGILDLCSIAESCTRFKDLMCQSFHRKYKILKLNFGPMVSTDTAVQARRLFRSFGAQIVELEIQFRRNFVRDRPNSYSAAIMDAVIRYCTELKSLILTRFDIPDNKNTFVGIGQLFSKLEKLQLREVFIEDIGSEFDWMENDIDTPNGNSIDFFGNCPSLNELTLTESYFLYPSIFGSSFPSLEHFIIAEDAGSCQNDKMENFILRHPNLKTFSLYCDDYHVPFLAENCKSLQKLGFQADYGKEMSLESFHKFHNLRELTCFAVYEYMPTIVKELPKLANSLELLDLSYGCVTFDFIQIISKLNKLKVFRLYEIAADTKCILDLNPLGELNEITDLCLDIHHIRYARHTKSCTFDLVKIVNRLKKLTKLQFDVDDYKIPKATYLQLLNVVESRPVARNRHLTIASSYIGTILKDDCKDALRATVKFANSPIEADKVIFIF